MPRPDPALREITDAELGRVLDRTCKDEFVVWTGGVYGNRDSLRFNSISKAVTTPGRPVSLRQIIEHAARRDGTKGHPPAKVRQGNNFHQGSKPTVFIWLRRGPDGVYRTVRDAPVIHKVGCNVRAGTPIDPHRFL